jgi:rhodanese-related sulfurtransferase
VREVKPVLAEATVVLLAGLGFAFLANLGSPRGLSLLEDHFPGGIRPLPPSTNHLAMPGATNGFVAQSNALALVVARLKEKGLQVANSNQMARWYYDPRYQQEYIIFVDSRNEEDYQAGHVPGAYHFDHYYPAQYLPGVLAACQTAETIVAYCNGGTCEESEFAAVALRNARVPNEKLHVYLGGFSEWATNGWPVELGARKSGQMRGTANP